MRVLLVSTYEMGRQPFGLASPAAWLRRAGAEVVALDLSRQRLDPAAVSAADVAAFYLPMHTATRLALPVIDRVRAQNPRARLCAFGLYASPNRRLLAERGVSAVFGGEFEADLAAFVFQAEVPPSDAGRAGIARLAFVPPDRTGLPEPQRYASLQDGDRRRVAGYTEASRGCKHRCRHCPIVPIYDGQFRVVPVDIVVGDIAAQAAMGVEHVTFGDPDFFNGPAHAMRVVEAVHERFPGLTYDVTIKVEHLLQHDALLPRLAATGCRFVTSAFESFDDAVLGILEKGHRADDAERAAARCRDLGLPLAPTFVPFTPWTTLDACAHLLEMVARLGLIEAVSPIQYAIRLLVPEGSRLLELEDVRRLLGPFDAVSLAYPWTHQDPRVDLLQREVQALVGSRLAARRADLFARIHEMTCHVAGIASTGRLADGGGIARAAVPYLNEPWYC